MPSLTLPKLNQKLEYMTMQAETIKPQTISLRFLLLGLATFLTLTTPRPALAQNTPQNPPTNNNNVPTRSYTGLGGNIGLGGDSTALGEGGFSLVGRTAIVRNISLHTSTVFTGDSVGTFALTFGVPIFASAGDRLELLYPFVGGGIAVEDFFGDFDTDGLVTAGVDVPILERVTATARINLGFAEDDTDVGLLLGVGYNFSIFELF
ncbi:MAG: hypothetical protein AAGK10_14580 [Cyanobacteria bacterium J06555_3]